MSKQRTAVRFKYSALAIALGMCVAIGDVSAQSVTGNIYGTGAAGGQVLIESLDNGSTVTVTPDANGRYTASSLPTGRYRVTLQKDGAVVSTREDVEVLVGRGVQVGFGGNGDATNLGTVQVVGQSHQIDVSQIESRTVITKAEYDRLPLAQNLGQIALLAPGVVSGDSRYGSNGNALPSFNGSSQSENAYYINGFPVINPLTNVGYTQLPFASIGQIQVSTSGYGPEYGRSTGGVVSVVTARGTNDFVAGGQVIFAPNSLRASPRNIYYGPNNRTFPETPGSVPNSTAYGNAGQIAQYRNENSQDTKTYSLYVGGPIIKDRLFFYAGGEFVDQENNGTRLLASSNNVVTGTAASSSRQVGWLHDETSIPRWLGKLDWNITDNHRIELTGIQDRTRTFDEYSGFDYANEAYTHNNVVASGLQTDNRNRTYIGNYTGFIGDDFTVTAMYGESKFDHVSVPLNYSAACPAIAFGSVAPGLPQNTCQNQSTGTQILVPGANDKTKAYRLNLEYRIGRHTLSAGYDYQDVQSVTGSNLAGGSNFTYASQDPNTPISVSQGVGTPASGGGFGTQGFYVIRSINTGRSDIEVEQKAEYVKDLWQVTDNVLLQLGLRNDQFTNFNSAGQPFAEKNRQLAPRLGATWDVYGDASLKVFANAGRYILAMPPNVAFRGADGIINTQEYFTYTGIDATTGVPTGTTPISGVVSANNEFGQSKDPRIIAKQDLSSHFQDAFTLGMEQKLGAYNVGAKATYATLRGAIDDFCDYRPFQAWGARNGYTQADADNFAGSFGCALFNPGEGGTFLQDYDGDGTLEKIKLTKEDLGYPKLKRKYYALDVFLEKPFDGKWYGRIDYTLSKNTGNAEGQLLSDLGQADVSQTQNFDFPEIEIGADGLLPNNRRHQVKLLGYYQVADELLVSGSFRYASGRPRNCLGQLPDQTSPAAGYGSSFFFCNGVFTPRGTFGQLPAFYTLDLGVRYSPNWLKGASVAMDVFNATNRQSASNIGEQLYQAQTPNINQNYGRVISYSGPRYVQFTVRYDWGKKN